VKPSFSRAFNIDAPWHPTAPETMIASPGRAAPQEISIPSISSPTPAVTMKIPSASPLRTTLVSPATISTPASVADARIEPTIRRNSSRRNPSSMMNAAERWRGRAPFTERSFDVPQTASRPMSPPGKKRGLTVKASVVKARRAGPNSTSAASSSRFRSSLP